MYFLKLFLVASIKVNDPILKFHPLIAVSVEQLTNLLVLDFVQGGLAFVPLVGYWRE
jgi:hypothetical protein